MRLLVLGGSRFLSRAVATAALRDGHEVTCACRGSVPVPEGARHVSLDRSVPGQAAAMLGDDYDAVVDVASRPTWVHAAVAAVPSAHWVYVSSVSVYADESVPGGGPGTLPLLPPIDEDRDLSTDIEAYGGMKVACERAVLDVMPRATVVRPGLIVGPEDPSGRFTYWPVRLAEPGPVLAPGPAESFAQVVDVRDLAELLLRCAVERTAGVMDGVGPVLTWAALLASVAEGVGNDPDVRWVDGGRLVELDVAPWAGPDSLPMWLPPGDYDGMMAHDPAPAAAAGLACRAIAETARDTLAWARANPGAVTGGMSREREAEVLAAAAVSLG